MSKDTTELDDAFGHLIDQIATRRVTDEDITSTKQALLLWKDREVIKVLSDLEQEYISVLPEIFPTSERRSIEAVECRTIRKYISQLQSNLKEKE